MGTIILLAMQIAAADPFDQAKATYEHVRHH
jgi:hypothetical protein